MGPPVAVSIADQAPSCSAPPPSTDVPDSGPTTSRSGSGSTPCGPLRPPDDARGDHGVVKGRPQREQVWPLPFRHRVEPVGQKDDEQLLLRIDPERRARETGVA